MGKELENQNPLELLGEFIIEESGSFRRVLRIWKGWHPELKSAVLSKNEYGLITKQEITTIKPTIVINLDHK